MAATVSPSTPQYVYPGLSGGSPSSTAAPAMPLGTVEQPYANPTAPKGMKWTSFQGEPPLFGSEGPKVSDVVQGSLDDCFVASSLADLAQSDPTWIKQNIKQVGTPENPLYQVTVYYQGAPATVTMDDKLLTKEDGTQASMGRSADGSVKSEALWPALYEKAYAMVAGTDANATINSGGYPMGAMKTFAGGGSANQPLSAAGDFAALVKGGKYDISLDTQEGSRSLPGWDPATKTASLVNGKYTVKATSDNAMTVTDPKTKKTWDVAMPHCYSVMGVSSINPAQTDPTKCSAADLSVELYNPWGQTFTDKQGIKSMPYDLVQALFAKQVLGDRPKQVVPAA